MDLLVLLIILAVVAVLVLALIGFIHVINWLGNAADRRRALSAPPQPAA
jgi:hypothetical protein